MKKYYLHYGDAPIFWLNGISLKGILKQLSKKGMTSPNCIECNNQIFWKGEDYETLAN